MAGRLYEEKESQGAAVLFSKENRNGPFLMEKDQEEKESLTPLAVFHMIQGLAAGGDEALSRGAALWMKERRVCNFSPELAAVLRRQAAQESWKLTTAMISTMEPVIYIRPHERGEGGEDGFFVWREEGALHFQSVLEGGEAALTGLLPLGEGIRPFHACLQEVDEAMRPVVAVWLELFLYTLAENREEAEKIYCFSLPDGKEEDMTWLTLGTKTGEAVRRDRLWLEEEEKKGFPTIKGYRKLPRPHIRASHWHEYHTGTRKKVIEERPVTFRWVAPLLVNREAYEAYRAARQ